MHCTRNLLQKMLVLSEQHVQQCLTMSDCLRVNRVALTSIVTKEANVPTRLSLPYQDVHAPSDATPDWTLFKPASYSPTINNNGDNNALITPTVMGQKIVSIRSINERKGLPLVPANVVLLDPETGIVSAIVSATYLTAARTAAGSALSTLAILSLDENSSHHHHHHHDNNHSNTTHTANLRKVEHLVVFGAGLQAKCHVEAIYTAITESEQQQKTDSMIPKITIINKTVQRAQNLQQIILEKQWSNDVNVVQLGVDALGVTEALSTASVVVTATNSTSPLWRGVGLLPPKAHIVAVGAYTPEMREVPAAVVDTCRVLVDTPEAKQVGDLQSLTPAHPVSLLGELLLDPHHWLQHNPPSGFLPNTMYKSVGTAIQDVLTADFCVKKARELGIGTEVDMS